MRPVKTHYELLGLEPSADADAIKKAFRRLARELHPDTNTEDPQAEDKFKEAASRLENEAHKLYEVAQSGDEAAVKTQIGAVGKACGGCHNDFRQKQ